MKYPTDPEVRAEMLRLRSELKTTNKDLASMLAMEGVTETFISKYINDKLDRLVENFEARFRDTVRSIRERIAFGSAIFETSVTRRIANACDLVRRTGDFGLVTSPAGNGKTSGVHAYCYANPSAVKVTLNATTRGASKLESMVFASIDTETWKGTTSRFDYLATRFRETSRLLIIDNIQRLDSSGRQWLADFHDEADCPVMGIGNPEAVKAWQLVDQQRSRIGFYNEYELDEDEIPACALKVAQQFSDESTAAAIEDLVSFIATHEGRLRSVKKTVILAQELRAASASLRENPCAAIRSAHARLLRNFDLPPA